MKSYSILLLFVFSHTVAAQTTDKNAKELDKGAASDWVEASLPPDVLSAQPARDFNSKVKVDFESKTKPEEFTSIRKPFDFGLSGPAVADSQPLDTGNVTTEEPAATTVKRLKMYQMWRFKNFERVPTYVPGKRGGVRRSTTKSPTNGEGDYRILEINRPNPKGGGTMGGNLAK